jgi:hypothetical protein
MRLKHLYYRTNSNRVSEWNCDICVISWLWARNGESHQTTTEAVESWTQPPFCVGLLFLLNLESTSSDPV